MDVKSRRRGLEEDLSPEGRGKSWVECRSQDFGEGASAVFSGAATTGEGVSKDFALTTKRLLGWYGAGRQGARQRAKRWSFGALESGGVGGHPASSKPATSPGGTGRELRVGT